MGPSRCRQGRGGSPCAPGAVAGGAGTGLTVLPGRCWLASGCWFPARPRPAPCHAFESRNPSKNRAQGCWETALSLSQSKQAARGLPGHQGDGHPGEQWGRRGPAVGTGQQQLSSMEVSWGGKGGTGDPPGGGSTAPASMGATPISFQKLLCQHWEEDAGPLFPQTRADR